MPGHLIEDVENLSLSDPVVEAHHRIANNLAIIAGLIRSELLTLSTDARPNIDYIERLLQQMSVRIDSLGRLHRLLMAPSHAGTVELGAYLREIVDAAGRSLTNTEHTKILCRFENGTTVPAKQAAAIGLLVGEALVNAIKHAHPLDEAGTIWVMCKPTEPAGLVVEIKDDGTGADLDSSTSAKPQTGTGARLMRGIAHDLGGELAFIKGNPGQIVRLKLPQSNPVPYAQAAE
jgi:two-component sensor histidine kinase